MLTLEIKAYGETIVRRQLTRFAAELESPREALEAVATRMREIVEMQFATEGGHASGGWKPLAEATVQRKARLGLDPHILRATDRLRRSLITKFDPQHIERPSRDSLVFGSTVPYGIYHQSSRPRTKIPYRPPIALTQSDKRGLVKIIQRTVIEHIRA